MAKRSRISLKKTHALELTRIATNAQKLVYVLVASKKLEYQNGRSAIAYIGTTKKGVGRIAGSAAARAQEILEIFGVKTITARILTCKPRHHVKTWLKLERAMLIVFREQYGTIPKCNTQGKNMKATDEFDYFARSAVFKMVEELGKVRRKNDTHLIQLALKARSISGVFACGNWRTNNSGYGSHAMGRPITKTDFVAGRQCPLNLWNRHHDPIPYKDRVETPAMRTGTNVGVLAQGLFPGGVLVDAKPWERDKAIERTKALIADKGVPAIFEAAFTHSGLHARVDILKRKRSGAFALYEVKSTGEVKEQHLPDLAFQVYVARKSGIKVNEAGIVHINKDYVRGTQVEAAGLFTLSDEIAAIADEIGQLPRRLKEQLRVLNGKAPAVVPSDQCHSPYSCEFWDRCTKDKPKDWIFHLYRLSNKRYEELCAQAIESIKAIQKKFGLNTIQARTRDVLQSKRPYIAPTLRDPLAEVAGAVCYLDFETVSPAVPLWPGTQPFERIPFQWSLHRRDADGQLHHSEYLADGAIDPRQAFSEALVKALRPYKHPIVVYHKGTEGTILRTLAALSKSGSRHLSQIEKLLWDLLPVVQNHVYFGKFNGSFSIKDVAPVLSRDVRYDSLDGVAEGIAASDAFIRIVTGELGEGETSDGLRSQLLKYCHLDTLAMVKVHEALDRLARQ